MAAKEAPGPDEAYLRLSKAVRLWERPGERNAPTAEQRWNELVYANAHGLPPYDSASRVKP